MDVFVCVCMCVRMCVLTIDGSKLLRFLAAELYQSCLGVRVVMNEPAQRTFFCPLMP